MYQRRKGASPTVWYSKLQKQQKRTHTYLLKKEAANAAEGRRKEAANGRGRKRRSGGGGYLFISESRHALLASVNTHEAEAERCGGDEEWRGRGGRGPLLDC